MFKLTGRAIGDWTGVAAYIGAAQARTKPKTRMNRIAHLIGPGRPGVWLSPFCGLACYPPQLRRERLGTPPREHQEDALPWFETFVSRSLKADTSDAAADWNDSQIITASLDNQHRDGQSKPWDIR